MDFGNLIKEAIENKNLPAIKFYMNLENENGRVNINQFFPGSSYAKLSLALAVGGQNFDIVKYFINNEADINLATKGHNDAPI